MVLPPSQVNRGRGGAGAAPPELSSGSAGGCTSSGLTYTTAANGNSATVGLGKGGAPPPPPPPPTTSTRTTARRNRIALLLAVFALMALTQLRAARDETKRLHLAVRGVSAKEISNNNNNTANTATTQLLFIGRTTPDQGEEDGDGDRRRSDAPRVESSSSSTMDAMTLAHLQRTSGAKTSNSESEAAAVDDGSSTSAVPGGSASSSAHESESKTNPLVDPTQPAPLLQLLHPLHNDGVSDATKIPGVDDANATTTTVPSTNLPAWFTEYTAWHAATRRALTEGNWHDYRYVLLRCVVGDAVCAGAADRLTAIPVIVRLASQAKRLLFIHWSRPAALEEFLVPPPPPPSTGGGLDWRLPPWLARKLDAEAAEPVWRMHRDGLRNTTTGDDTVVIRIRTVLYAHSYYDEHRASGEATMWEAYPHLWRALFVPSPAVQAAIDETRRALGLAPPQCGAYVAAHVRSVYASNTTDRREEENAVRCAAELSREYRALIAARSLAAPSSPSTSSLLLSSSANITADSNATLLPIYFASDSPEVTRRAIAFGAAHGIPVVGRSSGGGDNATLSRPTLHLDRGETFLTSAGGDWRGRPASDFYDTFVDLYLMSLAACHTYGAGGYGSWAAAIANPDRRCGRTIRHRKEQCAA